MDVLMTVVGFGSLAIEFNSVVLWVLTVLFSLFMGFARIYSVSHFPRQVLGGLLGGAFLLPFFQHLRHRIWPHNYPVPISRHTIPAAALIIPFLAVIFYRIENNLGMGIEKEEYIRVLRNIMNQEPSTGAALEAPRTGISRRRRRVQRDSFVQLMRSMERRAAVEQAAASGVGESKGSPESKLW
jgi:hypothetical protein